MKETVRFGRIAGIAVGAHWSVLVLVVLIVDGLAAVVLPDLSPGHRPATYWLTGTAVALLMVCSLLLHELTHALVAVRSGLPVDKIVLWMFGGVSVLGAEPKTPRSAFWIALSGPLTSLGLGVVSAGAAAAFDQSEASPLLVASASWLAVMNVFLGLFNLLPGVPLDGGRVIRAVLWWRSGDRDRAQISAAKSGRIVGALLALVGLAEMFAGQLTGLWLIAIGYLIVTAANAEARTAQLHLGLGTTKVADVMSPPEPTGYVLTTVQNFIDATVIRSGRLCYPVVDLDGRPTGTVSVHRLAGVPAATRTSVLLKDVQTPIARVPVTPPDELLADLLLRMPPGIDQPALVVDDGLRLVGIVTPYDAARVTQLSGLFPVGRVVPAADA
jgi:Zn-dependent protease